MIRVFKSSIIGYSDHSVGNTIPIAAMALGAKIIEKHFVIEKTEEVQISLVRWTKLS